MFLKEIFIFFRKFVKKIYEKNQNFFRIEPFPSFINLIQDKYREYFSVWSSRQIRYTDSKRLNKIFLSILKTPFFECNPNARMEIHTLSCHHHLYMYMTAVKSFLRYFKDIAIVVHDDGSLSDRDKALLREHIKGIKIIDKRVADKKMEKILAYFPNSRRYRARIVNSMELFDNILLAEKDQIICMNSDILFSKEPSELIAWILNGNNEIRGVYEGKPFLQKEILTEYGSSFPPHVTLALACFYKQIFDFEFLETILAKSKHDWCLGQNIYPLLFGNKSDEFKMHFFDKDEYQASGVFKYGAIFRHYWTSSGFFIDQQIADSKKVIDELLEWHNHE